MKPLRDRVREAERSAIEKALIKHSGIVGRAADELSMPKSSLATLLVHRYPDLGKEAEKMRASIGMSAGPGRPFEPTHDAADVARAWKQSEQTVAACARILGLPRTTMRSLLYRYGLLSKPKKKKAAA